MRSPRVMFYEVSTYGTAPTTRRTIKPPGCRDVTPVIGMITAMSAETLLPGMVAIEHTFDVPLDHGDPTGERITVFARELAAPDGRDRPFLVYLQGGPGFEAVRPTRRPDSPAWVDRALREYRVLMLDQRGTGRSSPVGTLPGLSGGAAGRLSGALPRRLDRARRRVDPARARCRAVERAWPELWGHVRRHLPLAGTRGAARGFHHRRTAGDRATHRRGLRAHVRDRARAQPTLLRALSGRPRRASGGCTR